MPHGKRKTVKIYRKPPPAQKTDDEPDFDPTFPELTTRKKVRLDEFIREYLKDFNGGAAVARMGLNYATPEGRRTQGSKFLNEPYTQYKLGKVMEKMDEKAIVSKNDVLFGLKQEATDRKFNSGSERISAWRALGKILGIEVTKVEGSVTVNGGVVAIPLAGSLDEWEKASAAAQAKLKQEVRK